jgi:hypothetical protein
MKQFVAGSVTLWQHGLRVRCHYDSRLPTRRHTELNVEPWRGSARIRRPVVKRTRYVRMPRYDTRVRRGDDFASDAWLDTVTGELLRVVVNFSPNTRRHIRTDGSVVTYK